MKAVEHTGHWQCLSREGSGERTRQKASVLHEDEVRDAEADADVLGLRCVGRRRNPTACVVQAANMGRHSGGGDRS